MNKRLPKLFRSSLAGAVAAGNSGRGPVMRNNLGVIHRQIGRRLLESIYRITAFLHNFKNQLISGHHRFVGIIDKAPLDIHPRLVISWLGRAADSATIVYLCDSLFAILQFRFRQPGGLEADRRPDHIRDRTAL